MASTLFRALLAGATSALCLAGGVAAAQEAGEHEARAPGATTAVKRFTLKEAVRLGASRGPEVALAFAPKAATQELASAAGAVFTILPRASVSVGERTGPLGAGPEVGVAVIQDVHLGGVRAARKEGAAALGRAVDLDGARARLDGGARAAFAWIGLAEADRVLALRRDAVEQASGILRVVGARVARGAADPIEQPLAQGDVATGRAAVLDAEGMWFEAAMELRFSIGEAADASVGIDGALDAVPDARGEEAALIQRAERDHPLVLLAEARAETASREARLTTAVLSPTIGLGASFVHEGTGDRIFTGVVSLPLPFSRPWNFDATRHRAHAAIAKAEATLARAELAREIRVALHEREHTRELLEALTGGAQGPLREALRIARVQFEAGTLDVTRVLLARQRLLATEEQIARALADVRRADVRLLRASGTLLEELGP